MQEDHFRKEGRYQENEENLAMFAIKERYIQYHNFMPWTQLAILMSCTQGYGSGGAIFQLSILHSTQGTKNVAQFSESHVPSLHHLQYRKLGAWDSWSKATQNPLSIVFMYGNMHLAISLHFPPAFHLWIPCAEWACRGEEEGRGCDGCCGEWWNSKTSVIQDAPYRKSAHLGNTSSS